MSEKNIYVFGTYWADKSILKKYLDDKVVFLDNQFKEFSDIASQIKSGDIIVLRTGTNMQHNVKFSYIGIANTNAQVQKMYSTYPLYEKDTYKALSYTDKDTDAVYVTVDKWYEIANEDNSAPGMAKRIIKVKNKDDYNKIMHIYNEFIIKDKNKMKKEIFDLLTSNHNLILTGVPGTGKTYLAKQIAAKMIFGEGITLEDIEKDEEKKAKFEYQYKFVQFHPSYDYTDFVEGIRPVAKKDNSHGFIRKDGTFKEFCKRALKNILDSQKTVDELSNEEVILYYLDEYTDFIIEQIDENDEYYIGENNRNLKLHMNYLEQDEDGIVFYFENNQNRVRMYFEEIIDMYNFYSDVKKNNKEFLIRDFLKYSRRTSRHDSYYYRFIKDFYDKFSKKIEKDLENKFAKTVKEEKFIFIIDEINRGDINKILGELFYAIDPGYRGEKGRVETQYQNLVESGDIFTSGFYIPENVYIIGTMNDIDRSVESMDFAIRRRFAWKEITPKETAEEILKDVKVAGANSVLKDLNDFIASAEGLGKMYQIGASYFLKLNGYVENSDITAKEAYTKLWHNHLKGLFYEYVRGKKNGGDICSNIENTYFNAVNDILA